VNSQSQFGRTPLSWAVANGHEIIVKLLLAIDKVDIDLRDNEYNRTPLL
jgi:ankyrin repeat protein